MERRRRAREPRRRWPPESRADLDWRQDHELESGPRRKGFTEFATEDKAREAWFALQSEYLAETHPGSRPHGWWRFEAPEPRKILGWKDAGASHRFGRDVPVEDVQFRDGQWTYVGKDTEVRTHLPGQVLMRDGTCADLYPVEEEDADYLRRLGLLRPDEKEKLDELRRQREEWKQQWASSPDLAFERDQQDAGNGGWLETK